MAAALSRLRLLTLAAAVGAYLPSENVGALQADAAPSPVLALLVHSPARGFTNAHLWDAWLANATRENVDVRMFINTWNSTAADARTIFEPARFRQFIINETTSSMWCDVTLLESILNLVRHGLADASVTHLVLVSETVVPAKSARAMRDMLAAEGRSRFCGLNVVSYPGSRMPRPFNQIATFAEAWWLMSREDALITVNDVPSNLALMSNLMHEEHVTCPEENYFLSAVMTHRFARPSADGSSIASDYIFGNDPDRAPAGVRLECPMLTDWMGPSPGAPGSIRATTDDGSYHIHLQYQSRERCNCSALLPSTSLSNAHATMVSPDNSNAHPFEWRRIDTVAYRQLLHSPFFFARKVGEDGVSSATADELFGAPVYAR